MISVYNNCEMFIIIIFTIGLSTNPLLKQLLENIRCGNANNADPLWELYIENLKKESEFTTNPEQIGAPENIRDYGNLEEFIEKYPKSKVINAAYERLVLWLSETKKFEKLKITCLDFLKNYPKSAIKEYIKFQLGNSYLELHDTTHAKQLFKSIKTDSMPESVYPGWSKTHIIKSLNNQLIKLGD